MGYNVKLGKGGHGLEVYDSEGKYADEFSFKMGEQEIKGYDGFRGLYFENLADNSTGQFSKEDLEQLYNTNKDFQAQVDENLYPEYNQILTNAVNDYNAKQVWDTPEEAAKHLDELFVPSLVQNLLENKIVNSSKSSVAAGYQVNTFAACLQMSRYAKNRANGVDISEYENEIQNNKADGYCSGTTNQAEFKNYIETAIAQGKSIPILRNISGISSYDRENVLRSYYDENSPRNSCLAHADAINCSYLGSVIYFSTGDYSYSGGYGLNVRGFVKMNNQLKLLQCPVNWHGASEGVCNRSIPEINKFRQAINSDSNFKERIINKFVDIGKVSSSEAETIYRRFKYEIDNNPGFCAMLMGYDAIYGISYHFDILNLGICDLVKE